MSMTFTILQKDKFLKAIRNRPRLLFMAIKKRWQVIGGELIKEIVQEQLSGRKGKRGLNRISGHAASALNIKTKIIVNDVIQNMFLNKNNPAKVYLPIHDESRKGDGIISAKNKPYLHFPIKGIRLYSKRGNKKLKRAKREIQGWVKVKSVQIPVRTSIIRTYIKKTKPKLYEAIQGAVAQTMRQSGYKSSYV